MNCLLPFIVFGSTYTLNKCSRMKPLSCCQRTVSAGQQWCRADVSRTDTDTSIVCGALISNRFHNSVHKTQQCRYNSVVKLSCLLNQALLFREGASAPILSDCMVTLCMVFTWYILGVHIFVYVITSFNNLFRVNVPHNIE